MNEEDVFSHTKDAYLHLIRPTRLGDGYQQEIITVVEFAASVPSELVSAMIAGPSWRERLLGLCMAMTKPTEAFVQPMLQSLRNPCGISITPTCAALAVIVKQGVYKLPESFAEMFDRSVFDGEIGWATDKTVQFLGLSKIKLHERGPYYGQIFEDHAELYFWAQTR
ncbi:MAG: hypothetical protein QM813_04920 [Verrucomicrobiota bacterium]